MKKFYTMLCFVFLLMTSFTLAIANSPEYDNYEMIFTPCEPNSDYAPVYAEPNYESEILGSCRGGLFVPLAEKKNGWYRIIIGHPPAVVYGYMPANIFTEDGPGILSAYVCVTGSGDQAVNVYEQPNAETSVLGKYDSGTCLELLGIYGDFYHVRMGSSERDETASFIKKEDTVPCDRPYVPGVGIDAIGYAVVKEEAISDTPVWFRSFPSIESVAIDNAPLANEGGGPFDIVALTSGEWCQVRWSVDVEQGFLPKEILDLFVFSEAAERYGIPLKPEAYEIIEMP